MRHLLSEYVSLYDTNPGRRRHQMMHENRSAVPGKPIGFIEADSDRVSKCTACRGKKLPHGPRLLENQNVNTTTCHEEDQNHNSSSSSGNPPHFHHHHNVSRTSSHHPLSETLKIFILFLLLLLPHLPIISASVTDYYSDYEYQLITDSQKNFDDAEDACVNWGGHLIWLENEDEYNFMYDNLIDPANFRVTDVWIGLFRNSFMATTWRWTVDSQPASYEAHLSVDGLDNCARLISGSTNEKSCGNSYYYICKREYFCDSVTPSSASVCSGKGTCTAPDVCSCDPGWDPTTFCNLPTCDSIPSSSPSVCSGHGVCLAPDDCSCDPAWDGTPFCSEPICYSKLASDEDVCSGHGTCDNPDTCSCMDGYSGSNCERIDCFGHWSDEIGTVCFSHGSCIAPDTCDCESGFGGDQCEWNLCFGKLGNDTEVCSSRGSCIGHDTCTCISADYSGNECQLTRCYGYWSNDVTLVCSGRGTCFQPDNCTCPEGWGGEECQFPICFGLLANDPTVCSQNGSCVAPDVCSCVQGYSADSCQTPICYDIPGNETESCSGHGNCVSPNLCDCVSTFRGDNCSYPVCFGLDASQSGVCESQGDCLEPDLCACHEGYAGAECELFVCHGYLSNDTENVCSGNGDCLHPDMCICGGGGVNEAGGHGGRGSIEPHHSNTTNYGGENCEIPICHGHLANESSLVCSARGDCVAPSNCSCHNGYAGPNCEWSYCHGNLSTETSVVCSSGHGVCVDYNTCVCHHGYAGEQCQMIQCFSHYSNETEVCSSHGSCFAPNNCSCHETYTAEDCSVPICWGIPSTNPSACSSHGVCSSPNHCDCHLGYGGAQCELFNCFGLWSNESLVCESHGNCIEVDSCACDAHYFSSDCSTTTCFGINSTQVGEVCSSHGSCDAYNSCTCTNDFLGSNCEYYSCFGLLPSDSLTCSSHGDCTASQHCECFEGYSGPDCNEYYCFGHLVNESSVVCSGRGDCIATDECDCFEGYEGINCSVYRCGDLFPSDEMVCSGHGVCMPSRTCDCDEGYAGEYCSSFECFDLSSRDELVCSGHGTCVGVDTCTCEVGYEGESCNNFTCFGLSFHLEETCSHHGDCIGLDTCSCNYGYAGENCSIPMCFGEYLPESVCSGHGECLHPDTCACHSGYTMAKCDRIMCFGRLDNDSQVCSSHGTCDHADVCSCEKGFSGERCHEFPCFFKSADDDDSCSGHGSCLSANNCTCASGYTGVECEHAICNGIAASDNESVCSGHGTCVDVNVCICDENYDGVDCGYPICFGMWNSSGGEYHDLPIPMLVPSNDTSHLPCNGFPCIAPDTCDCGGPNRFANLDCSNPICFGESHPSLTCSGRGFCAGPNVCQCETGFKGVNCELRAHFLLPHGDERDDQVIEGVEDFNTNTISLHTNQFFYFGAPKNSLRLSSNGYITFGDMLHQAPNDLTADSISSLEADLILFGYTYTDLTQIFNSSSKNKIFYRQSTKSGLPTTEGEEADLSILTEFVREEFYFDPELSSFEASWYFVVTADRIGYYPKKMDRLNSVQVILTTDETRNLSMIIFNFCNEGIEYPEWNALIGLQAWSNIHSTPSFVDVMALGSDPSRNDSAHLISATNVQTKGFYSFPTHSYNALESYLSPPAITCFGIPHTNTSTVCSGHGSCTEADTCICEPYTKGAQCEVSCYPNDTSASWSGIYCDKPRCWNRTWNDPMVCSGHGSCQAVDTCECDSEFYGHDCSEYFCYGIPASNTSGVCSGHGTCTRSDTCVCTDGWESGVNASDCSMFTCGGRAPNEEDACYNGGTCVGPDTCIGCATPFFGELCAEAYRYVDSVNGNDHGNNTCLWRSNPCKTLGKVLQHVTLKNRIVLMGGTYKFPLSSFYVKSSLYFLGEDGAVLSTQSSHAWNTSPLVVNFRSNIEIAFRNVTLDRIRAGTLIQVYYGSNFHLHLENVTFLEGNKLLQYEGLGDDSTAALGVSMRQVRHVGGMDSLLVVDDVSVSKSIVDLDEIWVENCHTDTSWLDMSGVHSASISNLSVHDFRGGTLITGAAITQINFTNAELVSCDCAALVSHQYGYSLSMNNVSASNCHTVNSLYQMDNITSIHMQQISVYNSFTNSHGSVALINNASNVILMDSMFQNVSTPTGNGTIHVRNVHTVHMSNCIVQNCLASYGSFLYTQFASQIDIHNIRVATNIASSSIHHTQTYLSGKGSALYIHDAKEGPTMLYSPLVRINNSYFDSCDTSLYTQGSFAISFTNNTVKNNQLGAVQIRSNDALWITFHRNRFENNINSNGFGGAISLLEVTALITIRDTQFINNAAIHGGSIFAIEVDRILLMDSTMKNCSASESGGALYAETVNSLEAYNCGSFSNRAYSGGALYLRKVVKSLYFVRYGGSLLKNCAFNNNTAHQGGALYLSTENVIEIVSSAFMNNHATRSGGAIHVEGQVYSNVVPGAAYSFQELLLLKPQAGLLVNGSQFVHNSAGDIGGALSCFSSSIRFSVVGSYFSHNQAVSKGGSFFLLVHSGELYNNTIRYSVAEKGAAFYVLMVTSEVNGLQLSHHVMSDNRASKEGVIYLSAAVVFSMRQSTMSGSIVESGAVFAGASSRLHVSHCEFSNNVAESKGGVFEIMEACTLSCEHVVFVSNRASRGGVGYIVMAGMESGVDAGVGTSADTSVDTPPPPPPYQWHNVTLHNNFAQFGGSFYIDAMGESDNNNTSPLSPTNWYITNSTLNDTAQIAGGSFYVNTANQGPPPPANLTSFVHITSSSNGYGPWYASNPREIIVSHLKLGTGNETDSSSSGIPLLKLTSFPSQFINVKLNIHDAYGQAIDSFPGLSIKISSSLNLVGVLQQTLEDGEVYFDSIIVRGKQFASGEIEFSSEGLPIATKRSLLSIELQDCPQGYRAATGDVYDECVVCARGSYSIVPGSTLCHDNCEGFSCGGGYSIDYDSGYWIEAERNGKLRAVPCPSGHCVGGEFEYLSEGHLLPFMVGVMDAESEMDSSTSTLQILADVSPQAIPQTTPNTSPQTSTLNQTLIYYSGAQCTGNRKGVLCGACKQGYELFQSKCVPCKGTNPLLILFHVTHLLIMQAYVHYTSQSDQSGAASKILISFMQTSLLIVDVERWASANEMSALVSFMGILRSIFEFQVPSFAGETPTTGSFTLTGCPFPRPGYWIYGYDLLHFMSYIVIITGGALLSQLFCFGCARHASRNSQSTSSQVVNSHSIHHTSSSAFSQVLEMGGGLLHLPEDASSSSSTHYTYRLVSRLVTKFGLYFTLQSFVRTLINTIIFSFQPLTHLTVNYLLGCFKLETGDRVLIHSTHLSCWNSTEYWVWSVPFIILFGLIVFGPSVMVLFLRFNRHRLHGQGYSNTDNFYGYFGALYNVYNEDEYWFEWIFMTKRLLLILATVVSQMLSISYGLDGIQFSLYAIILVFTYLFVLNYNPYKEQGDNSAEKFSLFMCLLILGAQEGASEYAESFGVVLGMVLMTLCVVVLFGWVVLGNQVVSRFIHGMMLLFCSKDDGRKKHVIVPENFGLDVEDEVPLFQQHIGSIQTCSIHSQSRSRSRSRSQSQSIYCKEKVEDAVQWWLPRADSPILQEEDSIKRKRNMQDFNTLQRMQSKNFSGNTLPIRVVSGQQGEELREHSQEYRCWSPPLPPIHVPTSSSSSSTIVLPFSSTDGGVNEWTPNTPTSHYTTADELDCFSMDSIEESHEEHVVDEMSSSGDRDSPGGLFADDEIPRLICLVSSIDVNSINEGRTRECR